MKLYQIVADDNHDEKSNNAFAVMKKAAANAPLMAISPIGAAAMMAIKAKVIPITFSQAQLFINATHAAWRIGELYAEHPVRNRALIPFSDYNDFIKQDMVSDIANYIMDHFPVKKLLIGIVSSGKAGADAAIPVNDIDVSAKLSCSLEKGHYLKYEDTECSDEEHEYFWVDRFPEIKAAVEHKAKGFEKIQISEVDLIANVDVAKKISVNLTSSKKMQMYVSYCCE